MARKHVVKSGISLLIILIVLATIYFKSSNENENYGSQQVRPLTKDTANQEKVTKKKNSSPSIPSSPECNDLRQEIEKEIKEKAKGEEVLHWVNYFLKKDGIEYVLRIERDENKQGKEIRKMSFFKLDEDGFPIPFSDLHGEVVLNEEQISKVLEGYKVLQKDKVTSYRDESIIVNWSDDKIQKINNRISNLNCSY